MIIIMKAYSPSILKQPQPGVNYSQREIKREREREERDGEPGVLQNLTPNNSGHCALKTSELMSVVICNY